MSTQRRNLIALTTIALLLTFLLSRANFVVDGLAPILYGTGRFIWELALSFSDVTYWILLGIAGAGTIALMYMRFVLSWDGGGNTTIKTNSDKIKGPVETNVNLLESLDESDFYRNQLAGELSRKLIRALDRPEVKRRDIDQLLIDDALNLSPMIADFLLDQTTSGHTVDVVVNETIAHIEDILGIGSVREGAA